VAAEYKPPAVYFERFFVRAGDLMSYGPDLVHSTAKRLTTWIVSSRVRNRATPSMLLARADEVVE
jgi:hypothetical protein